MAGAQVHANALPSIEVALDINSSADSSSGVELGGSDGPELFEGLRAIDGRLVVSPGGEDVVVGAIAVDGTLAGSSGGWVVVTPRLDDVVLNESVTRPAVDGEVAVAVGLVCTSVCDFSEIWV